MSIVPWTDAMKHMLRRLHRDHDGLPFGVIAQRISEAFGRVVTKNACIGMARRMELPMRGKRGPLARAPKPPRVYKPKPKPQPHAVGAAVPDEPVEKEPPFGACDIYSLRPISARPSSCRWPLGPPTSSPPYLYCGDPTVGERPYCAFHNGISYVRARSRFVPV